MNNKIKTKPNDFKEFHRLLTHGISWKPWYFKLNKDKDPLERTPWKILPSKLSGKRAYQWMCAGFNVGIAATNMDPLVIIDIDDIEVTPDSVMKSTLTVTSRKRLGRHYFYLTEDPKCKINVPTDDGGEIRANWQYVVAPGSYVETDEDLINLMSDDEKGNAGYYTLLNKIYPKYITYNNIPEIFKLVINKEKEREPIIKNWCDNRSELYNLTVADIFNIPNKQRNFPSMFHNSKTGKNTSMEGDWITCWRHNVSHNNLSSLVVMSGLASCQDAGWGHDGSGVGPSTINFKDGEVIYKLWKFAKKLNLIPDDDIIPNPARIYCKNLFK